MLNFSLLLKVLLVLHGLNEALFGTYMMLSPVAAGQAMGCADLDSETVIMLIGMYGAAALSIGVLSLWLSTINDYSAAFKACIWVLFVFHLSMTINQLVRSPDIQTAAVHGVFALLFVAAALKLASIRRVSSDTR